jgi:hypothetical protein
VDGKYLHFMFVCPNYYLFPFSRPSPSTVIMLGTINTDVIEVGTKGQQVEYGNKNIILLS